MTREQAIALSFEDGKWSYKGEASTVWATETQNEVLEAMRLAGRPLRQKEIADLLGRKNAGFTKTLQRMEIQELVIRDKNLLYSLPEKEPEALRKYEKKTETTSEE